MSLFQSPSWKSEKGRKIKSGFWCLQSWVQKRKRGRLHAI